MRYPPLVLDFEFRIENDITQTKNRIKIPQSPFPNPPLNYSKLFKGEAFLELGNHYIPSESILNSFR